MKKQILLLLFIYLFFLECRISFLKLYCIFLSPKRKKKNKICRNEEPTKDDELNWKKVSEFVVGYCLNFEFI